MARSSSGFVAGLTVAAVAAIGFLAYQASAHVPDTLGKPQVKKSPGAGASGTPAAAARADSSREDAMVSGTASGEVSGKNARPCLPATGL